VAGGNRAGTETEAVEAVGAPPIAPGQEAIDVGHLSRMTLGERALEREVLQLFDMQAGILLARMSSGTPKALAGFAHTLSGSARGIGAWRVAEAAETIERLAGRPGPIGLAAAIERLGTAIREAQATITDLLRAR
jgi:HPt (histidine-containing phosphotransfer) domain-containing protein